jgi:type II secretory pathway component PulJ
MHARTQSDHRRSGFTLVELVAAISMLTTILVMTGTIFHLLLRSDKAAAQSFITERSISRLAVQFRDDIHHALTANLVEDPAQSKPVLELSNPPQMKLHYVVTQKGIARLTIDGDAVSAREDYQLPDCRIRFQVDDQDNPRLRSLIVERPGVVMTTKPQSPQPFRTLAIEASLDRFHSFAVDRSIEKPADAIDVQRPAKEGVR